VSHPPQQGPGRCRGRKRNLAHFQVKKTRPLASGNMEYHVAMLNFFTFHDNC